MSYLYMLPDLGMNYTLNRALNDGTAKARIEETRALAPRIHGFDSWSSVWLETARKAESEHRWARLCGLLPQCRVLPARRGCAQQPV